MALPSGHAKKLEHVFTPENLPGQRRAADICKPA
jgi:hypothetical protein